MRQTLARYHGGAVLRCDVVHGCCNLCGCRYRADPALTNASHDYPGSLDSLWAEDKLERNSGSDNLSNRRCSSLPSLEGPHNSSGQSNNHVAVAIQLVLPIESVGPGVCDLSLALHQSELIQSQESFLGSLKCQAG